jgi:TM2 domain-containing membrane protein YozV
MNDNLIMMIPGIDLDELAYLNSLTKDLSPEQLKTFAMLYNAERRKPDHILLGGLLGLFAVAGVQRFMVNQIGMGILYFFTAGLCFIGTIIDLVNYKSLAFEFNQQVAVRVMRAAVSLT